jgi:hypothetical protein
MDNAVLTRLVNHRDPEDAIRLLLSYYSNHERDAIAIFSSWGRIRRRVYMDDDNRDPSYLASIQDLLQHAHTHSDVIKLNSLLKASLQVQHRTYTQAKPYLTDHDLDMELKEIPACFEEFYQFQLPSHIVDFYHEARISNDIATQTHSKHDRDRYSLSQEEADVIISVSIDVLQAEINSVSDYYENVVALQVLSGRRNAEILFSLVWSPASHPYQATVTGLTKSKSIDGITRQHTIPLLCRYELFDKAMTRLRAYRLYESIHDTHNAAKPISSAAERLFRRRLAHSEKRNLYSEMAWRNREQNGFLIGDQSCSKHYWIAMALGHDFNLDHTSRYQTLTISP